MNKLLFAILAIIIAVAFGALVYSVGAVANNVAYVPIIYYPNEIAIGSDWVYCHNARKEGTDTKVICSVPGICWELTAQKIGKTLWIRTHKEGQCASAPVPPWPLPSGWEWFFPIYGDIEGVLYLGNAKEACSDFFSDPENCVEVK